MKKFSKAISLVLCLVLVFLVSCGEGDASEEIKASLSSPFEYKVQCAEFTFIYNKQADKVTMTVVYPETLQNLSLEKNANGISASYDGLVVTLPQSAADKIFAVDNAVDSIVKSIEAKAQTIESTNGNTKLTTVDGGITYHVNYDCQNKRITSVEINKNNENRVFTFVY